jgi:2-polyprenyl-3-methyl-5-hydroxy-6-metoxy-1,4-benzoquinol methylase
MAYANYFTHGSAQAPNHAPPSAWRRHRIAQRNAYLNHQYGYKLEPAAARVTRWLSTDRRQRWDKFVCFLNWPGKGARLLDIGCANGGFLLQMQSIGWEVAGVEPDPKAVAQAQAAGLDVRPGLLQADTFPKAHFDAITMGHVIEHLHEPLETLRNCFTVMKPGGVIAIATPNFQSFGHSIFGRDWFALEIPRHLVLFTPESLRLALKSTGFEPEANLRPRMVSNNIFRRSVHLQRGSDPIREKPPLSPAAKLKRLWLTWRADRATTARPELTEEIVQLARRPS